MIAQPSQSARPSFALDLVADAWTEPFARWAEALRVELAPAGMLEEALFDQILLAAWRSRQALGMELAGTPGDKDWQRYHAQAQRDWSRATSDFQRHRKAADRSRPPAPRREPPPIEVPAPAPTPPAPRAEAEVPQAAPIEAKVPAPVVAQASGPVEASAPAPIQAPTGSPPVIAPDQAETFGLEPIEPFEPGPAFGQPGWSVPKPPG